jgi:trehalose 6-phosphate synthase
VSDLVVVSHHTPRSSGLRHARPERTERLLAAVRRAAPERTIRWVGTTPSSAANPAGVDAATSTHRIELDDRTVGSFDHGFCRTTLRRLYHDAARPPAYHRHWWESYRDVNVRCADTVATVAPPDAIVWVHGHELQLLPSLLRDRRPDMRIGYFHELPQPPLELFLQLPWRTQIVEGVLGADVAGFQHPAAARNFAASVGRLVSAHGTARRIRHRDRSVVLGAYPMSVDFSLFDEFSRQTATTARVERLRGLLGQPRVLLLGIDAQDATAGVEIRLRAFAELLRDGELQVPDCVMVQLVRPGWEARNRATEAQPDVHRLIGQINGEFGRVGAPAVHYLHRDVPLDDLVALYRATDVLLVTPLRSAMDLVAKEYVASRVFERGALVLSEFSGAARELRGAITVNPHDLDGLKAAILSAVHLEAAEVGARMRAMRAVVRRWDSRRWAGAFLADLDAAR